jgi:hypothetical protein
LETGLQLRETISIQGVMNMKWTKTLFTVALLSGLSAGASAAVLLNLTNPAAQMDTPESLSFIATGSSVTLSVAGYQVNNYEQATLNGVTLGAGPNLLVTIWNFTAAASGSLSNQYSDGSGVNALNFGGVTEGSYDTYSQTFSTIAGDTYTYKFDFTEDAAGPSGLLVSASGATAVPLPASVWLMLSGLVGVGAMARKRRAA